MMRWAASVGVLVTLVFLAGPAWAKKPSPAPLPTETPTETVSPSATESPPPVPTDTPSPSDTPTLTPSPTDPPTPSPPTPSPTTPATSSSSVPPTMHPPPGNHQAAGPSLPSDKPAGFGGFPGGFIADASSPVQPSPPPAESISADDPGSPPPPIPAATVPPDVHTDQSDVGFVAMFVGIGVVVFAVAAFTGWHSRG